MANFLRLKAIMIYAVVFIVMGAQAQGPSAVGALGAECDGRQKLCIDPAICANNRCTCPSGYTPDSPGRICLKEADEWQGNCVDDTQCHAFDDAVCTNNICDCKDGYHFYDKACWTTRKLNEECKDTNECYLNPHADRIECSAEGVCVCKDGYTINETGNDCNGAEGLWKVGFPSLLFIYVIIINQFS